MNNKKLAILILIVFIFVGIITFPSKKPVLKSDDPVLADTATTPKLIKPTYAKKYDVVADIVLKSDGSDMTSKIQNALNECSNTGGGTVYLEKGVYNVSRPITVNSMCTLMGDYQDPDSYQGELDYGTKIVVDVNTFKPDKDDLERTGLFILKASSGVDGLTIYYKNQDLNNPKPQPWSIHYTEYMLFNVKNVTLINSYLGIGRSTSMGAHEMLMIENVKGTILKKGVVIHNSADVGTITGLYFSPKYWAKANLKAFNDSNGKKYTEASISSKVKSLGGFGLEITDAEQSEYANISLAGFKYGIYIPNADVIRSRLFGSGTVYNLNISDCEVGIKVESGIYKDCSFGNCTMIDYRWGYLISNSSIAGSSYAIDTASPTVNVRVGTLKLNDVTIKGKVNGVGAVIYNKSGNSYTTVPKGTDLTGVVNNTNKFSIVDLNRKKKTGGSNFTYLAGGSSVDAINSALANISKKGGGIVYLKPGIYNINKSVNIPSNTELRGSSSSSTREFRIGTRFVVKNEIGKNRAVNIVGSNSGISGINIIYESNVKSLNTSKNYTGYDYAIRADSSNNIFVTNVTISGASHGIYINSCNGFTLENIITGILENAFRIDNSSNGLIINSLQNGTVIARNYLFAYEEKKIFDNIFKPTTYGKFNQVVINGSSDIQLQNIFAYGIQRSIAISNSKGVYAVNIGKDATPGTIIEANNSEAMMINSLKFGTVKSVNNSKLSVFNISEPNNIYEKDTINNPFKITKKYLEATLKLSSNSLTFGNLSTKEVSYEYDGDGKISCSSSNTSVAKCSVNATKRIISITSVANNTSSASIIVRASSGANYASTTSSIDVMISMIKGDVNGDGKVNAIDYILIRKHILSSPKLTGDKLTRADVNSDNKVDSKDYIIVRKIIISGIGSDHTVKDTTPPTINKWTSTSLSDTKIDSNSATTTICNLGSDVGSGLKTIEYYTDCTNVKTATINSNKCATITIDACSKSKLYYKLKDKDNNSSNLNTVNDIGKYLILAQEYNYLLYPGTPAANDTENLTYHTDRCPVLSACVTSIGEVAVKQRSSDNDTKFLERVYRGILGRNSDTGGLNSWINNLKNGKTRSMAVEGFANSTEAKNIYSKWGYN